MASSSDLNPLQNLPYSVYKQTIWPIKNTKLLLYKPRELAERELVKIDREAFERNFRLERNFSNFFNSKLFDHTRFWNLKVGALQNASNFSQALSGPSQSQTDCFQLKHRQFHLDCSEWQRDSLKESLFKRIHREVCPSSIYFNFLTFKIKKSKELNQWLGLRADSEIEIGRYQKGELEMFVLHIT